MFHFNYCLSIKLRHTVLLSVGASLLLTSCSKTPLPTPGSGLASLSSQSVRACVASKTPCQLTATSQADANDKALALYRRLAGVSVPVTNSVVQAMATKLLAGDAIGAAALATGQSDFLNTTVRYMGVKMSYRDEQPNHISNDFVSALVGAVRDDISAQDLLTGNFYFTVDPNKVPNNAAGTPAIRTDLFNDILTTNNQFTDLDAVGFDNSLLTRVDGMVVVSGQGTTTAMPVKDTSPLITSRGFTAAHAIAGTNRRMYEYTFREFMCVAMTDFSDTTRADEYVGRDVNRYDQTYQVKCKGCHAQMDGMRGAFANIDFYDNAAGVAFLKHSAVLPGQPLSENTAENMFNFKIFSNTDGGTPMYPGVIRKMNRNEAVFPAGRIIDSDFWTNLATGTGNAAYFGWNGPMSGNGIKAFATMIASSDRFPKCMATKVFKEVCKRLPNDGDKVMIDLAGQQFKANGYKLKSLFQFVSTQTECTGN